MAIYFTVVISEEDSYTQKIESIFGISGKDISKIVIKEEIKDRIYFKTKIKEKKYIIFSDGMYTTKEGMNGKVPLIILLDDDLKVRELIIDKNRETTVQIERIKKRNFINSVKKYVNGEENKIDTIAGATYTSRAILEGCMNSIEKLKKYEKNKK